MEHGESPAVTALILDTTLSLCTAVLADATTVIAARSELLDRGHAERLPSLVEAVLADAGAAYSDLTSIVAVNGPGTFAGVRVAISFAGGIALARDLTAGGIGLHQVLASDADGDRAVYIVARGGLAMRQLFRDGQQTDKPETASLDHWQAQPEWSWPSLGAALPGADLEGIPNIEARTATPDRLAIAALNAGPLEALYLRPPDAAKARPVFKVADA